VKYTSRFNDRQRNCAKLESTKCIDNQNISDAMSRRPLSLSCDLELWSATL